ncbi:hypothetical protein [Lacihabitans soyangensis]|uniref:DUF3575 domain-containing protein n=1 Tax=Lacihabitans soyangensis TaxID=869394 RepID=A0AAE3KSR3_9BACT|nr:hypothetical protein [Lacihabitans soyangensis]MCP9763627.1 hypothetical protein [Lacihabitans soyangensis]
MQKLLFLIVMFALQKTSAQSFLNLDIGNSILLRPNLGYEYRWKNKAIGGNIRWQRNVFVWISEWPSLPTVSGLNVDLIYRKLYRKHFFAETGTRFTRFEAPMTLYGWRIVSLYNSKNKVEPFVKIGLNTNRNKKLQLDFGIGLGSVFSNQSLELNMDEFQEVFVKLKPDEKIEDYFTKPKDIIISIAPHAQLRLFYRIRK